MPMDSPPLGLALETITVGHDSQGVALQDSNPRRNDAQPVPQSQYRHATLSEPWPSMNFRDIDRPAAATATHTREWEGYPQHLFGNWTQTQVEHSQMLVKCSKNRPSTIYWMDVDDEGKVTNPDVAGGGHISTVTAPYHRFWDMLQRERPAKIRVRSLFVDHLTEPVLKMLGTKYNIEPSFFASSVNWIPSQYKEPLGYENELHITLTLPFARTSPTPSGSQSPRSTDNRINTEEPLPLSNGDELSIDLLAIHMVRNEQSSTIISYHPESTSSPAKRLHSLMLLVGDSVYWQNLFHRSRDPTFLLLPILWYALYAWDEPLESLYNHVRSLESDVLTESRVEHTRGLHTLQAYLLHYESLLHSFQLSVFFIKNNPNPAMESQCIFEEQRLSSNELMQKECDKLLSKIDRLEKRREMLSRQLKNVIDLAFANVNIRDSASMRQITYLTMVFLPASLIASVFGMNVIEINPQSLETLNHYVEATIALTVFTFYIVVTLQTHTAFHEKGAKLQRRAAWPILLLWRAVERMKMFLGPQEKPKRV